MRIIQAPHQSLRTTAEPISKLTDEIYEYLQALRSTLFSARNPRGVGLASPQVVTGANDAHRPKTPLRVFATQFDPNAVDRTTLDGVDLFINPRIESHSHQKTLGKDDQYTLEGCLSIKHIYGPAPRWEWVEIAYEQLVDTADSPTLETQTQRFDAFDARVIQHEIDHLDGILFTDYILKHDLPVYTDQTEDGSLEKLSSTAPLELL